MKNKDKYKMNRLAVVVSISIAIVLSSCNDLEQEPTHEFTEANYWTSPQDAMGMLSRAYSQMYDAGYMFSTECLSDNVFQRRPSDEKTITSGLADASNGRFQREWNDSYRCIKTCHILLANIESVPMDPELKARVIAETRFIRAFSFFRLTTWFGDVPHFTTDISLEESRNVTRKPQAEVLTWIRAELEDIKEILPKREEYSLADRGRITRGAAAMLLARTYLYVRMPDTEWEKVRDICRDIMDGVYGHYELFPSYEGIFTAENQYNSEIILDIQYVPRLRTWDNMQDLIPRAAGARVNGFAPTQELVDDYINIGFGSLSPGAPFASLDPRLIQTVVNHGYRWQMPDGEYITIEIDPLTTAVNAPDRYKPASDETPTGYFLRKWYDITYTGDNIASGMNIILMRYADVLLMYAEAKNELGEFNQTVWEETIVPLRERAAVTTEIWNSNSNDYELTLIEFGPMALQYPSVATQEMRQTILRRERRAELAIEGTRVFDLRRWGTAVEVLNGSAHGARFANNNTENIRLEPIRRFDPLRDYLWAIPQLERDRVGHDKLTQNPRY